MDSLSSRYSNPQRGEHPVNLCLLFNKNSWDSIAFITPYLPTNELDNIDFRNMTSSLRDTMYYVVGREWNYGLIFLKKNSVVSYSVVGGNPSFSEIMGKDAVGIPIIGRSECERKLINVPSKNNKQSFFFVPLDYPSLEMNEDSEEPLVLDSLLSKPSKF